MVYVCMGKNCPRRLVCKSSDTHLYQCAVIDFECSDENGWKHFVRNDATIESLNTLKHALQHTHEKQIQQIDSSIRYLKEIAE